MKPEFSYAGQDPAVQAAMTSLCITDPNPFRAARAPGARALFDALKPLPPSQAIKTPEAMPVTTASITELAPIFDHLSRGQAPVGPAFPRGATFDDGRLDMCKQVVGPEYIGDLTNAVRAGGASAEVDHFLIGNNVVGDQGAADIAQMVSDTSGPALRTLYLAGNAFSVAGMRSLAQGLVTNTSVRALWLKRNPLGPDAGAVLGDMLGQNTALETLDLVNTGLGDTGVAALFDGLARNQTLRTLYLDANALGPYAADAMAHYFEQLASTGRSGLTGLFLGINRLGCDGTARLAEGLGRYGKLKRLDVGANRIELAGLKALLAMSCVSPDLQFLGMGFYKSASDLGELPNWFGDAGAALIADHIRSGKAPKAIELKDVHIGGDGLALLGDALEAPSGILELAAAQYGLKQPALFTRIERFLDRNTRAELGIKLREHRNGPLRHLKHGDHIDDIASIYRNTM